MKLNFISNNIFTKRRQFILNQEIAKEYIALIPNLFESFSELNKGASELTHMQNHVIEYIYMQQKSLNLKEISSGLNVAKQQLTNIISELVSTGYLIKETDKKDKRAILISLSAKGTKTQEEKWKAIYQKFSENLSKLNEEDRRDLQFALHKVNLLLNKMED